MKIVDINCFKLRKQEAVGEDFWEERLARPVDIYERFRNDGPKVLGGTTVEQNFVEISSDEGFKGIFGPISDNIANIIMRDLKRLIVGEDPFAVEKMIHSRLRKYGISYIDIKFMDGKENALWL